MIGASIAVLGMGAAGSIAYALLHAEDSFAGVSSTAGDLSVRYGEGTWEQVTQGVENPASGTLAGGTAGFHSMPGDLIEVRVPLTTVLRGHNLNATMRAEMGAGAARDIATGRIAATFRVEDTEGAAVSEEVELGTPLQVAGLEGSNEGISSDWTAIVGISVLGDYRWTEIDPALDPGQWSVDGVSVTLEQTRTGAGFDQEGGGA